MLSRPLIKFGSLTLALLIAFWAQWQIEQSGPLYMILFLVAGLLFSLPFWPRSEADPLPYQQLPGVAKKRILDRWLAQVVCLSFTIYLIALAYQWLAGNQFTTLGTWAWLSAVMFWWLTFGERRVEKGDWKRWRSVPAYEWLIWFGIMSLAIFFRFYQVSQIPPEMTSDHAEKLLDVYDLLQGQRPIFFPRNTGREAFQFYLTAILIWLTPLQLSHLALKVGTGLIGLIPIPFTYLLGKELYNKRVGWLAAFLLAVSHWHVAITRVGLRFPFTAAFATPTFYFLLRALKYNRRNDWLWCGLFLGIGLHTYIPMRMVPVAMMGLVLIKLTIDGIQRLRQQVVPASTWSLSFWGNAIVGGGISFLLFFPLFRYMIEEPEMFWYRASSRAVAADSRHLWLVFWGNVRDALLMFNYEGDLVWANTIPKSPVLDRVTAVFFLLGVVLWLWRLVVYHDRRPLYLSSMIFVMLLPSTLSLAFPVENPSVVRAGGAIPLVMITAAVPLALLWDLLAKHSVRWRSSVAGLSLALLLGCTIWLNYTWYFHDYAAYYTRSSWNTTEMGQLVQEFGDEYGNLDGAYHVAYPYWVDTRNIAINGGDITWHNVVLEQEQFETHPQIPGPKLYILHLNDTDSLKRLQALFPEGEAFVYASGIVGEGKDFMVFRVGE